MRSLSPRALFSVAIVVLSFSVLLMSAADGIAAPNLGGYVFTPNSCDCTIRGVRASIKAYPTWAPDTWGLVARVDAESGGNLIQTGYFVVPSGGDIDKTCLSTSLHYYVETISNGGSTFTCLDRGTAPYNERHRFNVQRSSSCGGSCWRAYRDGSLLTNALGSSLFGPAQTGIASGEVTGVPGTAPNNTGNMSASWGCVNTCNDTTGDRRLQVTDTTDGSTWTDIMNSDSSQVNILNSWTITNGPSDGVFYAAR